MKWRRRNPVKRQTFLITSKRSGNSIHTLSSPASAESLNRFNQITASFFPLFFLFVFSWTDKHKLSSPNDAFFDLVFSVLMLRNQTTMATASHYQQRRWKLSLWCDSTKILFFVPCSFFVGFFSSWDHCQNAVVCYRQPHISAKEKTQKLEEFFFKKSKILNAIFSVSFLLEFRYFRWRFFFFFFVSSLCWSLDKKRAMNGNTTTTIESPKMRQTKWKESDEKRERKKQC